MLYIFIIFFFIIYIIGELTKYRRIESFKEKKKVYNEPVVYIKFVSICIVIILILINRILPSSVIERSNGVINSIIYFVILSIMGYISFLDIRKISKNDKSQ